MSNGLIPALVEMRIKNRRNTWECSQAALRALALMAVDIDPFGKINDAYGHKAGDQVLEPVAGAMQRFFCSDEVVVRMGGEKFAVVLPNAALAQAYDKAEELRSNIESLQPCNIPMTVSLRVAVLVGHECSEDLFSRADAAMYCSKANGRNRVEVSRKMSKPSNDLSALNPAILEIFI